MALKLPDSAVPMGDFPVAKAVDIDFDDGENLQEKMDNGTLGGGGVEKIYTSTPIGTVLSFAGQTPPNGYLLCDGGIYAVADYQDLYDVIGNIYGGDTEYFYVPNLIDKFIQGSNTSGTEKEAGLPNITGKSTGNAAPSTKPSPIGAFYTGPVETVSSFPASTTAGALLFDASHSNAIYGNSDTVQPPALTMAYIIKAFHTNEGVDTTVELEDNVINHIDNQIDDKINGFTEQVTERVTERISQVIIVGTEYPTTETCPAGCWYGMYIE